MGVGEEQDLAVDAGVLHGAGAVVGSQAVGTDTAVLAGLQVALVDLVLAVPPGETMPAAAGEAVYPVHTGSVVQAGAGRERGCFSELFIIPHQRFV